jgi:hypothetical protein
MGGALAAFDARAFAKRRVRSARYAALYTAAKEFNGPDILHILANPYTAAAADALFRVQHDCRV